MEEDFDNLLYFSENVKNELHLYKRYLEYSKDRKINIGNKNWLIIDSSKMRYLKIIEELEKYNCDHTNYIRKIIDNDFLDKKGIDERRLLNAFYMGENNVNVLVVSDISEEQAKTKYGSKCTFFANLDTEINYDTKRRMIKYLVKDNHFKMGNTKNFDGLLNLSIEEIEKVLTRAFTMALDDKTNVINK